MAKNLLKTNASSVLTLASLAIAIIALLPMPYRYYILLKLSYCIILSWLSWKTFNIEKYRTWLFVSIPLALLYNPIIPIHLGSKSLWIAINLFTVIAIWLISRTVIRNNNI